ncbi:threonine synthase [Mongoliitalea lutea]|uniref:Threonine synthase n=1 Tax=Mongoliitalea lutea TaxID=849756 RepID=A0A8J3D1F9_9BACT|nr:threonine synthase [Mongoliitalea lutea]GHB49344.1 threonine synthase [Mongoliitalea lutea]
MKTTIKNISYLKSLECTACGKYFDPFSIQTFSTCCNKPLNATYDVTDGLEKEVLLKRPSTLWRYREMLPLLDTDNCVSLGEGMTPMVSLNNLGAQYGFENLLMKDESLNPTGSFKARGLSMAVSKAKELGIKSCIIPTAGNAGGAMSAYCAKAGMQATVIMPKNTPKLFKEECELYGANLILLDGLIDECGNLASELAARGDLFNMATLKEPYRLEGKKTMGYEIAEQYQWDLPDVIIYPTGGGTGLLGIWKAFLEMKSLKWLSNDSKLPKMIVVQSDLCSPVCDAFENSNNHRGFKMSIANGLSVPKAFGLDMIIQVLKSSQGRTIRISDLEILDGVREIGKNEGIVISPEGAAVWEALKKLKKQKFINPTDKILLINTGSGFKYMENY